MKNRDRKVGVNLEPKVRQFHPITSSLVRDPTSLTSEQAIAYILLGNGER